MKAEVERYRVPVNASNAVAEVAMASPVEIAVAEHCDGEVRGIALLVHGLSDTAFAMRDVANVLSESCFRSRTMLLPGHGTRPGDLLTTRLSHWQRTVAYLVDQAARESDTVVLAGFSLGSVLTLTEALRPNSPVDALSLIHI